MIMFSIAIYNKNKGNKTYAWSKVGGAVGWGEIEDEGCGGWGRGEEVEEEEEALQQIVSGLLQIKGIEKVGLIKKKNN